MQLIEWPQFLEDTLPFGGEPSAMTVGVFDGVHRGHQTLIERIIAHNDGTVPVAVTFRQSQFKNNHGAGREFPGNILSLRQKLNIFEGMGVSITIIIDFSESFRRMSGRDFFRILQEHGKMRFLAVGSNFRCGYQLDTDVPAIQKLNACRDIPTDVVQPLVHGDEPISSSKIRSAITRSDLKAAVAMLGRPFTVDLSGASVSPYKKADGKTDGNIADGSIADGSGAAYDIAGQGRLLPPPGRYPVFLLEKDGAQNTKKPAEILVEGGNIIIGGDLAGTGPEYVEFI